ncbi:DUF3325 domain-containing protein [Ectopseudomonas mendocina]|uniref:DUF3325 domain-containing protein n=1 Tax=Ectopseudomonas mendocina TaxID=300 RepID=A0ABZ2RBD4_ECTME
MLSILGASALAYSSMVGLCQGIKRHQVAVWGKPWPDYWHRMLRVYGWLALPLCLWLCAQHWGWAMGSVGVFGLVSLAGFILVLGLPYFPRFLVSLGFVGGVLGLLEFAYSLLF